MFPSNTEWALLLEEFQIEKERINGSSRVYIEKEGENGNIGF